MIIETITTKRYDPNGSCIGTSESCRNLYAAEELETTNPKGYRAAYENWYELSCQDGDWWDFIFDDFVTVAKTLGIEISTRSESYHVRREVRTRTTTEIYFELGGQGSGACWAGTYNSKAGAQAALREHAPEDRELHALADRLEILNLKYEYHLHCIVSKGSHHYNHDGTMSVECYHRGDSDDTEIDHDDTVELTNIFRGFARWMYKTLDDANMTRLSEGQFKDDARSNGWLFLSNGTRVEEEL